MSAPYTTFPNRLHQQPKARERLIGCGLCEARSGAPADRIPILKAKDLQ